MYRVLSPVIVWALTGICLGVYAQSPVRTFATLRVHQEQLRLYPDMAERQLAQERLTAAFAMPAQPPELVIPVVFHVLYSSENERIDLRRIRDQLDALNRDFSGIAAQEAAGFEGVKAGDTGIRFCLGELNQNGRRIPGVDYTASRRARWLANHDIANPIAGGVQPYLPSACLNVWVANLADGVSGYAQLPGGPAGTDGIVIDYRFFGNGEGPSAPYDEGKTLTHLVGSYLNLLEIWGADEGCGDDRVTDTPPHNGPNLGCPTGYHISLCSGNPREMVMNFMDNTHDRCMYMFTKGQALRMRAVLAAGGLREGLAASAVGCASQAPPNGAMDRMLPAVDIYPNPARSYLDIGLQLDQESEIEVSISSPDGKIVYEAVWLEHAASKSVRVSCGKWPAGLYTCRVRIGQTYHTQTVSVAGR